MRDTAAPRLLIIGQGLDGGIAPVVSRLAHGLQKMDWVCAVRYVGRPAAARFVALDQQNQIDSQAIVTGRARSLAEIWGLIRSIVPISRVARRHRPDIVIFAGFIPALLYAPILRLVSSAHFVFWDHAPQKTFQTLKRLLFPLARHAIGHIVSLSPSMAQYVTQMFGVMPHDITLIPNGVPPEPWQIMAPAHDFTALRVLMPARFDLNQKDPVSLIRAVALLHARGVDIEASLVGSGVDEDRLHAAVVAADAAAYIHILPHNDDMPVLMERHNIVCLSTKFEGLPTVLIEGMLARRAVVASRVAGCVDVIREDVNGLLFEAGSAEDCARQLASLQQRLDMRQMIDAAFHEAVRVYAPQAMIEKFSDLLQAVMHAR